MNKINLSGLDMTLYTEKLDNGLEVYMLPYEKKKNYFISYATRYGSEVLEFMDNNKNTYKPPLGIAHFLEHKMFEQSNGEDPFTFFAKSGTDANASTSFDNTQYICYGTKEFANNLRYLLQFVNSPYFTDENVEKEKGIIAEEIKMYDDLPDFRLEMKLRECIYKNHPRRIDIAGTVDEINKITKEDLYHCYNSFYIPNNMFILLVGNFKKEEALNIIKEELGNKEKVVLAKKKEIKEPEKCEKEELSLKGNVEIPKVAFGLKVPCSKLSLKGIELDFYLNILSTILFGSSSLFQERVREEKILTDLSTEWEQLEDFRTFYMMASTLYPSELSDEIKKELSNININKNDFERIKKVWIANEVRMIDNIDETVNNLYYDILNYHEVISNKIELIKKMKVEKLEDLISKIDFKNISIVIMTKEKD